MESARRGYKLQEFVAHESDVNCLNIGKKSSRLFITGGVDRKVNLWTIGQPSPVLSLPGHTSSIESVTFDSAELLILAGAYSGTVKLWDLEEGKAVRTLTGHRGSCTSVEFHPFGEFFASGSVDTDLKIWDIRRKGCIHTYKGHSREIKTIKFSPDGRWVVSGGEDNVVKLWDLTAGKLLHEFKAHAGAIQSINFHTHEFLLATGSADRTVKFWDLETFEMIGSAGPEMTGVRSMIFHPDGNALFCGLDETLKVFSWEPVRCHDVVDMKWSILGDLSIYEGKLLGCSYHQSSVGVWVADISLISPYTIGMVPRALSEIEPLFNCSQSNNLRQEGHDLKSKPLAPEKNVDLQDEIKETIKSVYVTSSDRGEGASRSVKSNETVTTIVKNSSAFSPRKSDAKSVSKESLLNSSSVREAKSGDRDGFSGDPKMISSSFKSRGITQRSSGIKASMNARMSMPVVVPRERESLHRPKTSITRKEIASNDIDPLGNNSSPSYLMRRHSYGNIRTLTRNKGDESGLAAMADSSFQIVDVENKKPVVAEKFGKISSMDDNDKGSNSESSVSSTEKIQFKNTLGGNGSVPSSTVEVPAKNVRGVAIQHGRTRSLVESWEKFKVNPTPAAKSSSIPSSESEAVPSSVGTSNEMMEQGSRSYDDDGCSNAILQNHDSLINTLKSRLTKLQMVRHLWTESGMTGAITAIVKLPDHPVQVDVISVLVEKIESFTLDLFSLMLPLLAALLSSKTERHVDISLEMLVKLVRAFGAVVRTTASSPRPVGVDLYAEARQERCKQCWELLEEIKQELPSLIKKGGSVARRSVELNLALQS